jgi:hypothetical protein
MRRHAVTTPCPYPAIVLLAAAILIPATTARAQLPGLPDAAVDRPSRSILPAPVGIDETVMPPAPDRREPAGALSAPRDSGIPDVTDRLGPEQSEEELVRTSLLNRFGGLGFSALGRLTREGSLYVAEVMTRDRHWIEIVIDPRTGEILTPP